MKTRNELLKYIKKEYGQSRDLRIAVEALIFTPDGKLLLEKRSHLARDEAGKLEGVGGKLEESCNDLYEQVYKEITEEIGLERSVISIDDVLEVRKVTFWDTRENAECEWVIVSYLCRMLERKPLVKEKKTIEEIVALTMDELFQMEHSLLSRSTIAAITAYRARFGTMPYYVFK